MNVLLAAAKDDSRQGLIDVLKKRGHGVYVISDTEWTAAWVTEGVAYQAVIVDDAATQSGFRALKECRDRGYDGLFIVMVTSRSSGDFRSQAGMTVPRYDIGAIVTIIEVLEKK